MILPIDVLKARVLPGNMHRPGLARSGRMETVHRPAGTQPWLPETES